MDLREIIRLRGMVEHIKCPSRVRMTRSSEEDVPDVKGFMEEKSSVPVTSAEQMPVTGAERAADTSTEIEALESKGEQVLPRVPSSLPNHAQPATYPSKMEQPTPQPDEPIPAPKPDGTATALGTPMKQPAPPLTSEAPLPYLRSRPTLWR